MKKGIFIFVILSTIFALAACGNDTEKETKPNQANTEQTKSEQTLADSLQILKNEKAGEYLADSKGRTLYYFKKDQTGKSNCSGDCLTNWPAFTQKDFTTPKGFDKKDFDTITREDNGEKQVTYKGYPLYYFAKDQQQGEINGQGVKNVWFVVNSETKFE